MNPIGKNSRSVRMLIVIHLHRQITVPKATLKELLFAAAFAGLGAAALGNPVAGVLAFVLTPVAIRLLDSFVCK